MRAPIRAEAEAEVRQQGAAQVSTELRAHLRYDGSHQALEVPFGTAPDMKAAFEAAHLNRFGFISPERAILFEMVAAEVIGETGQTPDGVPFGKNPEPKSQISMYCDDDWKNVALFRREALPQDARITGPAVITEATGTSIVEPGWDARLDEMGNLILQRTTAKSHTRAAGTQAHPVLLEVMGNLFMSVADQMGAMLANTAWSVSIKVRLDFSGATFDAAGDLVANAPHVSVHLGSMSGSVKTVMHENAGDIHPGDAFMLNSPYNGGTHLPDVTVVTPVFWLGSRGHHADIGGRTPACAPPDSTHIDEEGVLIDKVRLVSRGTFQQVIAEQVLGSGRHPCRNISQNMANLKAQVAANETGRHALMQIADRYGLDVVTAYMGHVQDNAEEGVRQVLGQLPGGSFSYPMDHGAIIQVSVTVGQAAREVVIDFNGTSLQHNGN